ncbi:MAG: hypothetical protein E7158_06300 [Firmicutes bacterium]|nr:hypothetical protein [Bacillota bacterium]
MKDKKLKIIALSILLVTLIGAATYAYFELESEATNKTETKVQTSTFDIETSLTNLDGINAKDIPLINEEEIDTKAVTLDFDVKSLARTKLPGKFNIYLKDVEITNNFISEYFKWQLVMDGNVIGSGDFSDINTKGTPDSNKTNTNSKSYFSNYYIKQGINFNGFNKSNLSLKIYLLNAEVNQNSLLNGNLKAKVAVEAYQSDSLAYSEEVLHGADPVLTDDLVPVLIEDNGTVKKADTTKEWYSYEDKKWANAVILTSNPSTTYNVGDTILETDIESYFVWMPKYKYKLFHTNQADGYTSGQPATLGSDAQEIDVVFGLTNTTDTSTECATPMTSGATGNCADNKYMTHPAFISMNTNGLWIAKFETTGTTTGITVKPSSTSLRSLTPKQMFELGYNYKRVNESHMMKNTEWGAVAYLYHSEYGRCTNGTCEDIRINNNSSYLTGYAAADGTNQSTYPGTYGNDSTKTLTYNTTTGVKATTTGNITGVYDMSGGAWEYMASYRAGTLGESVFDSTSISSYDSKYFDVYDANSGWTTYSKRILGDATGEMGPIYYYADGDTSNRVHNNWYADGSDFVDSSYPWFVRGGHYDHGVLAGPFYFSRSSGGANGRLGFRLVLAP